MTFKTEFGHEGYLDYVERLDDRKYLARLRTGSHNLKIETGRGSEKVYDLDFCISVCSHSHFVSKCTIFRLIINKQS